MNEPHGPWPTGMRLSVAEDWDFTPDRLRRVGWLDQKGRVWTAIPSSREFDGGSLTPLLYGIGDAE